MNNEPPLNQHAEYLMFREAHDPKPAIVHAENEFPSFRPWETADIYMGLGLEAEFPITGIKGSPSG